MLFWKPFFSVGCVLSHTCILTHCTDLAIPLHVLCIIYMHGKAVFRADRQMEILYLTKTHLFHASIYSDWCTEKLYLTHREFHLQYQELNLGPRTLESLALPIELSRLARNGLFIWTIYRHSNRCKPRAYLKKVSFFKISKLLNSLKLQIL